MAEKGRPGVMFYFDMQPSLKRLSLEEKGRLFEGILDYAQNGVLPEFEGMLGVAWDFIRPHVDRDGQRYEEISESRRKAARKRWDKQEEEPQTDANACFALQPMPTTTTTSTTTTKTTTTPSTTTTPTFIPNAMPTAAGRSSPDRRAVEKEMSFEELRRQKINMLECMMGNS